MRRALLVWLVCFAGYAAAIPVDASRGTRHDPSEQAHLQVAAAIASGGDVTPPGVVSGLGFPLLIAPAQALGGATAVELWVAALAAAAMALALVVARRLVPEPWATRGVLVAGLSPPLLAYGASAHAEPAAAAILMAALVLALRVRERPTWRESLLGAALIGALPWLGTHYLLLAAPVAVVLVRWAGRRGRGLRGLVAAEVMAASLLVYVSVNDQLYGGWTPYAAAVGADPGPASGLSEATGVDSWTDLVERLPRLAALWIDRDDGLLRWAPVFALAFFGAYLLWRSRRDRIAQAIRARADAEVAAALLVAVCAAAVAVAAFAAPTRSGAWFAGRHLVPALPAAAALGAWGLRHAPRAGAAAAALTLLASGWLAAGFTWGEAGGWIRPRTRAPLGPLLDGLPRFGTGSAWAAVCAGALAAAALALVVREGRRWARGRRGMPSSTGEVG